MKFNWCCQGKYRQTAIRYSVCTVHVHLHVLRISYIYEDLQYKHGSVSTQYDYT